jgi:hypothetical protein
MRSLVIILISLFAVSSLQAQSRVGTTAANFLTLGAGAPGASLGHAYTATATGADALFWNPGGAAIAHRSGQRAGLFFSNNQWIAGIDYNATGLTIPVSRNGIVGLSVASVDYGTMKVRTIADPEGTGETFSASDLSVGLSYAMPLTPNFYFGGTTKLVRQSIRDMRARTMAIDVGFVLVTDYFNGLRVAASIMNFGGKMTMGGINSEIQVDIDPGHDGSSESIPARLKMDAWDLPMSFKFGLALPVVNTETTELALLADANQTNDNNLNADFGAQFKYMTRMLTFNARAGYKDAFLDNVDSHVAYGAGLDLQLSGVRFGFDYAYVPFDLLDSTQIMDFRIYF